jgi:hypothetical protein
MVQCPVHDDAEPSLSVSQGPPGRELLLHCFGCGAKFEDLLAAVGVEHAKRPQVVVTAECQYLRSTEYEILGVVSRSARVGIDPGRNRPAVREGRFSAGDLIVKMPPRAGRFMRAVLEDLVVLANERIASGWMTKPIAYGKNVGAQRLDVPPSEVRKALKGLERAGVIERVRRRDWLGVAEAGAWTWRLVVEPAIDAHAEDVHSARPILTGAGC